MTDDWQESRDLEDTRRGTVPPASRAPSVQALRNSDFSGAAPTVLLVDDDPVFRSSCQRPLKSAGYEVALAANAEEALAAVGSVAYDVIITDVNMPGMDGIELLRCVRELDTLVSVIVLTGEPNSDSAARAAELGAMHYLIKPVETGRMLTVAKRATRMTRLARLQRCGGVAANGELSVAEPQRLGRDAQLARALGSLWLAHQPIVEAGSHHLMGYEALMRVDDASFPGPPAIVELAQECGRLPVLGRTVRHRAARAVSQLDEDLVLFVNIHPSDLLDESLRDGRGPLSQLASKVVLEVTERASIEGIPEVSAIVTELRRLGYRLAVDDLGAGFAGLSSLTVLEPEFVKIDMSLVRGIDSAPQKRRIVAGIIALARELGMTVVSEGVETVAEHNTLIDLGSHLLQGFLIGKPEREPHAPGRPGR